jgi:hypothetical protein
MAYITGLPPAKRERFAKYLRDNAALDAAVSQKGITVSAELSKAPFYKTLHLVSSGTVHQSAVDELEAWLQLRPWINPEAFALDDIKTNFLRFFPKDKNLGIRLYKLILPFFHCLPTNIKAIINFLAPHLAELAEVQDLWFVCQSPLVSKRNAAMRILHAVRDFPQLIEVPVEQYGGCRTLEQLQSTTSIGNSRELNFLFSLFTPSILGYAFEQLGGTYAFTFKNPKYYATDFPPRLQDLLRPSLFSEDRPLTEGGALANRKWEFPPGSTKLLLEYFVEQWGNFEAQLLNPLRFADANGELNVRRWHLTYSTVARMFIDATLAQTDYLSHYNRKLMTFRNLDSLSQILARHPAVLARPRNQPAQPRSEPDIFKHLLSRSVAIGKLGPELAKYPAPFGDILRDWNQSVVEELYSKTLSEIFVPGVRESGTVTISGTAMPEDDYVRAFLREVRNTQHGYNINQFKVLQVHSGSVPDCLGELARFPVLACLRNPALILDAAAIF